MTLLRLVCMLAIIAVGSFGAPHLSAAAPLPHSPLTIAIQSVPEQLEDISATIETEHGSGSGVIFTRVEADGTVINFVWTAAHVVAGSRTERDVVAPDGSKRTVVEFTDVKVVQLLHQSSRTIGRIEVDAQVIKYSDAEVGEDLALLRIRKSGFTQESVVFYAGKVPPDLGSDLYHVGSLLGEMGANSITTGIISQQGRVYDGKEYDQTTVTGMPGSSGGGVFLKSDGECIGLLTRGAGDTFNLIVPLRRMWDFAVRTNLEWAIDPSKPLPREEAMRLIPIEDTNSRLVGVKRD